jgi:hypothetical protein
MENSTIVLWKKKRNNGWDGSGLYIKTMQL